MVGEPLSIGELLELLLQSDVKESLGNIELLEEPHSFLSTSFLHNKLYDGTPNSPQKTSKQTSL